MNCAICFEGIANADENLIIGCSTHPFHVECYYLWGRSKKEGPKEEFKNDYCDSQTRITRECFICKVELPISNLLKTLKATDDSSFGLFEACASDNLELFEKQLFSRQSLLRRDFTEIVKVALDTGSMQVAKFIKSNVQHYLDAKERKELTLILYSKPSPNRYFWIVNQFDGPVEPREGIRSAEIVAEFEKGSAYFELYQIYIAELGNLSIKQQIDIMAILYDALQRNLLREFLTEERNKWDSSRYLFFKEILFLKMLMQTDRFYLKESRLELEDVARAIRAFCKEPLKMKRIFEFWHAFGNKEAMIQWNSYFGITGSKNLPRLPGPVPKKLQW